MFPGAVQRQVHSGEELHWEVQSRRHSSKRRKPITTVEGAGIFVDRIDDDHARGSLDRAETHHRIDQQQLAKALALHRDVAREPTNQKGGDSVIAWQALLLLWR